MLCPCCSELDFELCCKPLLDGKTQAVTPQSLMRSRYAAYSQQAIDYIHQTYAQSVRVKQSKADIAEWANSVTFVRLEIIDAPAVDKVSDDKGDSSEGFVEFAAHYFEKPKQGNNNRQSNTLHTLHEKSRFVRENGLWRYIDGTIIPVVAKAIGRNDPCPCLSGKKFKKCHG